MSFPVGRCPSSCPGHCGPRCLSPLSPTVPRPWGGPPLLRGAQRTQPCPQEPPVLAGAPRGAHPRADGPSWHGAPRSEMGGQQGDPSTGTAWVCAEPGGSRQAPVSSPLSGAGDGHSPLSPVALRFVDGDSPQAIRIQLQAASAAPGHADPSHVTSPSLTGTGWMNDRSRRSELPAPHHGEGEATSPQAPTPAGALPPSWGHLPPGSLGSWT